MKNLLIKKMIKSKKFWYAISSIVIPLIALKFGISAEWAANIFWAFVALTGAQGLADIGVYMKK